MTSNPIISFRNVHKAFGSQKVLDGVSVDIFPGRVHFIMGRSGAGKSVLTRQVVGLLRPDAGEVWVDGSEVSRFSESEFMPVRRKCQMIFQHATLFESMSVLENVAMPIRKRTGLSASEAKDKAVFALSKVHVQDLMKRMPTELGAGVKKRVAIARAIALDPQIMLYDEPTTSLDPVNARRTDRLIRKMSDELGITSMVVSHDLISLESIADKVTFLEGGEVAYEGSAKEMLKSKEPILQSFVGDPAKRWRPRT
jgi:phospholipid/cholesterol/gamma-HCH transport system ATP-binding protein